MRLRRLSKFNVKDILEAINQLQDAVTGLMPHKSSGTLTNHGAGGVTVKATSAATRAHVVQPPADSRPARWQ
jgi:hypothetical protein